MGTHPGIKGVDPFFVVFVVGVFVVDVPIALGAALIEADVVGVVVFAALHINIHVFGEGFGFLPGNKVALGGVVAPENGGKRQSIIHFFKINVH